MQEKFSDVWIGGVDMYAIAKKTENGMKYLCFNGKMIVGTKAEMQEYMIEDKTLEEYKDVQIVEVDDES